MFEVGICAPIYGPQASWVYEGAVNTFGTRFDIGELFGKLKSFQ